MKIFIIILMSFLMACSTIKGRDLPIMKSPQLILENKKSILIAYSTNRTLLMNKEVLEHYFNDLKLFSRVKVIDNDLQIDQSNTDEFDLKLRMDFADISFFEPYCIFTLMIIPCTPPIKWTLSVEATDKKNNSKSYVLKEDAVKITWFFGFLIPGWKSSEVKTEDLKENMLNNLIDRLNQDGFIR